jgi:hypothetical protein
MSSGPGLASLFEADNAASRDGNVSLQFRAIKQPKPGSALGLPAPPSDTTSSRPSISSAGVEAEITFQGRCNLWSLVGQTFEQFVPGDTDGQFGVVIMGKQQKTLFVYDRQKKMYISTAIDTSFRAMRQGDYISVLDNENKCWSLFMEEPADRDRFILAIALARSSAWTDEYHPLIIQDDADSSSNAAHAASEGNTVAIAYTAWLEGPGRASLGSQVDTNEDGGSSGGDHHRQLEFRIGERKVLRGLEEGTTGMTPGSRRWLIVPPHLAYGAVGVAARAIPPHAALVFRVTMLRSDRPAPAAAPDVPRLPGEGGITVRDAIRSLRPPSDSEESSSDGDWDDSNAAVSTADHGTGEPDEGGDGKDGEMSTPKGETAVPPVNLDSDVAEPAAAASAEAVQARGGIEASSCSGDDAAAPQEHGGGTRDGDEDRGGIRARMARLAGVGRGSLFGLPAAAAAAASAAQDHSGAEALHGAESMAVGQREFCAGCCVHAGG